jgi:hypothetical protein
LLFFPQVPPACVLIVVTGDKSLIILYVQLL